MAFFSKKYTFLAFFCSYLLVFSCTSDKKNTTENTTQDKITTFDTSQFLEDTLNFNSLAASENTQKQVEESYQKAKEAISIELSKNTKTKKQSQFVKKISALTQLDADKLSEIQHKKGLREIEKIIATLPENDSKKEAQRLTTLMRFGRVALSEEAEKYLLSENGNTMPIREKDIFYLNKYVEAAFLHSNVGEKIELNQTKLQKSAQLAKLLVLDFETFAIIESQLGVLGLHSAIINIPNFPQKEEALKIISK